MTTLLLVRHGQSDANLKHRFAGHFDADLTELGHQQAEQTALFLKEHYQVDKIFASNLSRAYATAEHAGHHLQLPVIPLEELREIYAGRWEGALYEQLMKDYPEEFRLWRENIGNARCTQGESVAELADRVWKIVSRIAAESDGQTVLFVSHATPIRSLQWRVTGGSLDQMQQVPWVSNASVTELQYENGVLKAVKIGQDAHLEALKTKLPASV